MAFTVQLDTLASAFVHASLSRQLMELWLASNPSAEEIEQFAEEAKAGVKSAHSENTLPDDVELLLIDRMIVHLDNFLSANLPRR